jgi:hypothetical protein
MSTFIELKESFKTEIEEADWSLLLPHYKRDALILIDPSLELTDVAATIADDQAPVIKAWMESDLLIRPTEEQVETWTEDQFTKLANFLIIQPYVLAQLVHN